MYIYIYNMYIYICTCMYVCMYTMGSLDLIWKMTTSRTLELNQGAIGIFKLRSLSCCNKHSSCLDLCSVCWTMF